MTENHFPSDSEQWAVWFWRERLRELKELYCALTSCVFDIAVEALSPERAFQNRGAGGCALI